MQTFRVSAWDLNTNTLLTDLQAKDVTYSVRLNDAGEFSLALSLVDPVAKGLTAVILGLGDIPFKLLVTANENARILFSGIAWKPQLSKQSTDLKLSGKALPSYLMMTVAAKDYTTSVAPTDLLAAVVADVQARAGYNLGIKTRLQTASVPPAITPSYPKTQLVTAAQIVSDITAAIAPGTGGVDYYMEDAFINGAPQHTLVIASPRGGRSSATSQLTVDLSAALDWTEDTDATASGNHLYVVGGGTGSAQPVAEGWSDIPVGGLGQPPRLEQVLQFNHVESQTQIQQIANGAVQMYGRPVKVRTVTLPTDYEPMPLGSFQIGDDVRVWSEPTMWHPTGLDSWWRIVAYQVVIANEGTSTMTLTLNRPPVY